VETLTDQAGDPKATYGYTAYGSNDHAQFTGIDKPDPADPTKQPYNIYRYNAKRWDPTSGSYDMGFRDYHPGLNRFLTRDMFNGALADLNLGLNPWTGNRYAFAGGKRSRDHRGQAKSRGCLCRECDGTMTTAANIPFSTMAETRGSAPSPIAK
jgi:RHS repeat-associated protein